MAPASGDHLTPFALDDLLVISTIVSIGEAAGHEPAVLSKSRL